MPGGFLTGNPQGGHRPPEGAGGEIPGAGAYFRVSLSVGVSKTEALEQLQRFAEEVMPAFRRTAARQPELVK